MTSYDFLNLISRGILFFMLTSAFTFFVDYVFKKMTFGEVEPNTLFSYLLDKMEFDFTINFLPYVIVISILIKTFPSITVDVHENKFVLFCFVIRVLTMVSEAMLEEEGEEE